MGETFPPDAVRRLLFGDFAIRVNDLLSRIPERRPLWRIGVDELHDRNAAPAALWHALLELHNVGPTKVSKLMARKRPHLIPIFDSVIGARIAGVVDYWRVFHAFLSRDANRDSVEALRPAGTDDGTTPTLRLLNTAVWMRYSAGESARAARVECGL